MSFTAQRDWRSKIGTINARRRRARNASSACRSLGFTLIELMIVISVLMILMTIGIAHYERTIQRAREATLKSDLKVMRDAIQDYTQDKEAAPNSLDDLVSEHYIAKIPADPVTGAQDWVPDTCDVMLSIDQTSMGICDVHAGTDQVSPFEGTPYNSW